MMPAVKHFDPVMGVDIHILIVPMVGPVPIPHPHVAMIMDPMDYVPVIGSTVNVGVLPRGTAGTAGKSIPHIPMGAPFSKPPMNESEIFMGSAMVLADGSPMTFTALPVLSCHDIGMISPPRKKPKKTYGMVLPTSMVTAIPAGLPVLVGGPPTIDMMGMAMAGGMKALGGAFGKLRKLQKGSKRMKKVSDAVHKKAKKAMDKLGVPPNVRNKVHKGICAITGHPVDVVTGKLFTECVDFELPGAIPLKWERTWFSTSVYRGALGQGWQHSYDLELLEDRKALAIRLPDGRPIGFPLLATGETCFHRAERCTLIRDSVGYALDTFDGYRYRFQQFDSSQKIHKLTHLVQKTSSAKVQFNYDSQARLTLIQDSAGRNVRLEYDMDNRIQKIIILGSDVNGDKKDTTLVQYSYQDDQLVQAKDAHGEPLVYRYHNGLLVQETYRSGLSFYFRFDQYDKDGRCVETWGDNGIYRRKLDYDAAKGVTKVENSLGAITRYYHDQVLPIKIVDPLNNATHITYNEYYQVVFEIDAAGFKKTFEYDDYGNTTKIVEADGSTTSLVYDSLNNLVQVMDVNGGEWNFIYDSHSRLQSEINPMGHATQYAYGPSGLSSIVDPNLNHFKLHYDINCNLIKIEDQKGVGFEWEYDDLGNPLVSKDSLGNCRKYSYDQLGRVVRILEPDGNVCSIEYDKQSNPIRIRDEQYDIELQYAGLNRLVCRSQLGNSIKIQYDTEEQITSIVNEGGHAYEFQLDANGEIIYESAFDGAVRYYERDGLGQILKITRGDGKYSIYRRDPLGRILEVLHQNGKKESFEYGRDGALLKAKNPSAVVEFERDKLGRVTKETRDDKHWVSSEYDSLGNRIRLETSFGYVQNFERDDLGYIHSISSHQSNIAAFSAHIERNTVGQEVQVRLPGGISNKWQRDGLGRPVSQNIASENRCFIDRRYSWGLGDRLLKISDHNQDEIKYHYDPLGNLAAAISSNDQQCLRGVDRVGNVYRSESTNDRTYGAGGQLLTKNEDGKITSYSYDEDGNRISKLEPDGQLWRYQWSSTGLLEQVALPFGDEVGFEYDPLGRRIRKVTAERSRQWLWDGDYIIHEWNDIDLAREKVGEDSKGCSFVPDGENSITEQQQNGSLSDPSLVTWVYDAEKFCPIGKIEGGAQFSIVSNYLDTPLSMFDSEGQLIWALELDVWGKQRESTGDASLCPFRWPGQYEDADIGLYYNRFRYYDPDAGGYISQDPIRLNGGVSLYAYPLNPLMEFDPFGLIVVYRLLRPDEDPAKGLNAKKPGRNMTIHGHVATGSRNKGSQFISTSTDPKALEKWRSPGQTMVSFDTDDVVPDVKGNQNVFDISDVGKAKKHGVGAVSANMAAKSKEVLVEAHVPPKAIKVCK